MRYLRYGGLLAILIFSGISASAQDHPAAPSSNELTHGSATKPIGNSVVRIDPALDEIISPDSQLTLLKGGFGFSEGILWIRKGEQGFLLISDMPANVIYKLTLDGALSVWLDHSGYTGHDIWRVGFIQTNGKSRDDPAFEEFAMIGSNGLAADRQGRVVIASWAGRSIDRIEPDGKRTVLADRWNGKRFGGTNDLVVARDGTIYFTDGYGGLRKRAKDPRKEIDFAGIYMLRQGNVTVAIKDIATPNGLAFSPDGKILYANTGRGKTVRAYDVQADGTLTNSRMFFDMSADKAGGIADGMKVDAKGNLWESGPKGIWIISPQGKLLGKIQTPELVANLDFGGTDGKTLYVAARTGIYKIQTKVTGAGK